MILYPINIKYLQQQVVYQCEGNPVAIDKRNMSKADCQETRLLNAMSKFADQLHALNQTLTVVNKQTETLSQGISTAERQLSSLYLPFQAAIYSLQNQNSGQNQEKHDLPEPQQI
uniref:AlNc14C187G8340 protein n=1 Tax=Albugo laibachii Nc14 TaxID=890382 RepID=F0WPJ5_9STRA|nr:AlNc14C187G8340 [Albugo laibachii Nc14]|eukprot:CCA23245.1 AlNc14C187G8340 [Albugo laibachii Nc14]